VITRPAAARPPRTLVRRILVRGHGRPVQSGQTVVVQYTGVVWRTGKVFDSSWARGFPESFQLGADQVIPGWESGLGGLPVGSRVLFVLPPSLGYGQPGDPPDADGHDTLIFVVDILAALCRRGRPHWAVSSQVPLQGRRVTRGNESFMAAAAPAGNRALGHDRGAPPLDRPANLAGICSREFANL
jgi:FKBP-type peptidyl-prolyl cis-trans isomerase